MTWSRLLLLLTILSWVYWLVACFCVMSFFAARRTLALANQSPVSVLKPLCGLDAALFENLQSFARQDYPEYELLFGVTDPGDPALDVVQRLQHRFPRLSIRAVVAPRTGPNDKVSVLCALAARARHDVLVVADSDMRADAGFLRRMVAPLGDPAVGLVTCLYRGADAENLPAILEALYIGATFLPSVLVARRYLNMGFALGASCALRRRDLEAIGGFEALLDYLADDYQLGARITATGKQVRLADCVLSTVLGTSNMSDQWHREVRWLKCARVSRPLEYPGLVLTFSTPLALLAAAAMGFSTLGCGVLAISLLVRWLVLRQVAEGMQDPLLRGAWLWLPLRDLLTAGVWLAALVGRRVSWRGRHFALRPGGRLQEVSPPALSPSPSRRVAP